MHARFYNPQLGRFLSVDPVNSGKPEAPQTWNRYSYAHNNPVRKVDPDGRVVTDALDLYSYQASARAWAVAAQNFIDNPSWNNGLTASARFLENAFDSAALLLPAVPAVMGAMHTGMTAAGGAADAIGFARGTASTALDPARLQHASRHLTEAGILGNWSKATGERFVELATGILEAPARTFDHTLRGGTAARGFLGFVDGKPVVIFVFKEGPQQGRVATSVVPSESQLRNWLQVP